MPRPGPRPYECVRRAWHSDRHQPMRGSLIQEIFRLANEVHSSGTRKNKEWQEKLPFVVLKAEEIMYSKANSEAEYMDLNTLWDRANDAIDTIIRKDDANESGDLLQPCIEAALNLGCIPRRASRSQRHNNPVSYLSPKEAAVVSHKSQDSNSKIHHQVSSTSMLPPLLPIQSSPLQCSPNQFASKPTVPEIQFMASSVLKEKNSSLEATKEEFSCIVKGFPMPKESCIWPGLGRVYPLYYGEGHHAPNSQLQSHTIAQEQTINTIFSPVIAVTTASKPPPLIECDLSLRLGLPCPPTFENESSCVYETEDAGSSSSYDGSKSCGPLPGGAGTVNLESSLSSAKDKWFDFFSVDNYESYMTNSCDRNQMGYASGALTDHCFRWKS